MRAFAQLRTRERKIMFSYKGTMCHGKWRHKDICKQLCYSGLTMMHFAYDNGLRAEKSVHPLIINYVFLVAHRVKPLTPKNYIQGCHFLQHKIYSSINTLMIDDRTLRPRISMLFSCSIHSTHAYLCNMIVTCFLIKGTHDENALKIPSFSPIFSLQCNNHIYTYSVPINAY